MNKFFIIKDFQKRFLDLRSFVGISRNYFEKFGFSAATIKSWETLKTTDFQINKAKIAQYISIYKQFLNIDVALEWLIYGTGDPPKYIDNFSIGNNFDYINKTVDLMLNNLPFFFTYDNDLVLRRINPIYAHLISNENIEEIENQSLANLLDEKTFLENKIKFNDALQGKTINLYIPLKVDKEKILDIPLRFCPFVGSNKMVFSFIEKII